MSVGIGYCKSRDNGRSTHGLRLAQNWQHRLRHVPSAEQVNVERLLNDRQVGVRRLLRIIEDAANIVDQHAEVAEVGLDLLHCGFDARLVGGVELDRMDVAADLADSLGRRVEVAAAE